MIKMVLVDCIMEKSCPHLVARGILRRPRSLALFTIARRRSAVNIKRRGERWSPWRTPLLQWKVLPGTPFSITDEVPDSMIIVVYFSHLSPKPLYFNVSIITLCSSLLKVFPKSSLGITICFLDCLHRCRYSKDQARQSWMVCSLIKPYLLLWSNLVTTFCGLFAISFVSSLTLVFIREMGR